VKSDFSVLRLNKNVQHIFASQICSIKSSGTGRRLWGVFSSHRSSASAFKNYFIDDIIDDIDDNGAQRRVLYFASSAALLPVN